MCVCVCVCACLSHVRVHTKLRTVDRWSKRPYAYHVVFQIVVYILIETLYSDNFLNILRCQRKTVKKLIYIANC